MRPSGHTPLYSIICLAKRKKELSDRISPEDVEPFLNSALTLRTVPAQDFICTFYTPVNTVFYVLSGSFSIIRTSLEGRNTVRVVDAPNFIGVDHAVLSHESYYAYIQAAVDCLVLEIPQSCFLRYIHEDAELCFEVLREICKKFYQISYRYDQSQLFTPQMKLMVYLVRQWIASGGSCSSLTLNTSNSRIAEEAGLSLRTFYRAVSKLKEQNLISVAAGNITFTSAQTEKMEDLLQPSREIAALPE